MQMEIEIEHSLKVDIIWQFQWIKSTDQSGSRYIDKYKSL